MYDKKLVLFITAMTPMHVGGENDLGVIDLPIQREGHTGFPKIEASSLKGSMRSALVDYTKSLPQPTSDQVEGNKLIQSELELVEKIYGSESSDSMNTSAVSYSDARILFFPVRSAKGVFAMVTCPMVLKRFQADLKRMGLESSKISALMTELIKTVEMSISAGKVITTKKSDLILDDENVVLEEFTYEADNTCSEAFDTFITNINTFIAPEVDYIASFLEFKAILVSDDDFSDFVQMSTPVITRIKIENETGIVKDGALFNEEYLPEETILYSLVMIQNTRPSKLRDKSNLDESPMESSAILEVLKKSSKTVQIGANATLGKGYVNCSFLESRGGGQNEIS